MNVQLIHYPNEILRSKSRPVNIKNQDFIRKISKKLIETCNKYQGIGLSGIQIGIPLRIFYAVDEIFINPNIVYKYNLYYWEEGCLSLPNCMVKVPRPETIIIEYYSIDGKKIEKEFSGVKARVILHEFDHLEGRLIIDYDTSLSGQRSSV